MVTRRDEFASVDPPADAAARRRAIARRAEAANIDPETLLATDYLNHFNEVVMLIDMLADMPECFEDVQAWAPKSYPDHFRDSNFAAKELAIEAYALAPAAYREPFDHTVAQLDRLIGESVAALEGNVAAGDLARLRLTASKASRRMQRLLDIAGAIIHGAETLDQHDIDAILND